MILLVAIGRHKCAAGTEPLNSIESLFLLHQGEGVTGIARAFLYAGSKGVMCSLWSVDDRETANPMVDFYGHLQKGKSAPEALREAQLAMIRAGKAPLYRAPFIVIGE